MEDLARAFTAVSDPGFATVIAQSKMETRVLGQTAKLRQVWEAAREQLDKEQARTKRGLERSELDDPLDEDTERSIKELWWA
eukprot:7984623-Lingulodinium_polyedra.AAC.1